MFGKEREPLGVALASAISAGFAEPAQHPLAEGDREHEGDDEEGIPNDEDDDRDGVHRSYPWDVPVGVTMRLPIAVGN